MPSWVDKGRFHGRDVHHGLEGWIISKSEGDRMDGQEATRQENLGLGLVGYLYTV